MVDPTSPSPNLEAGLLHSQASPLGKRCPGRDRACASDRYQHGVKDIQPDTNTEPGLVSGGKASCQGVSDGLGAAINYGMAAYRAGPWRPDGKGRQRSAMHQTKAVAFTSM